MVTIYSCITLLFGSAKRMGPYVPEVEQVPDEGLISFGSAYVKLLRHSLLGHSFCSRTILRLSRRCYAVSVWYFM